MTPCETALLAAETGHLVLSTLHTLDAMETVNRTITVFPAHQQSQIRRQLAAILKGVISQRLVPQADGRGRVPAVEVLIATSAVRNLIREGKQFQIPTLMQSGGKHGMQTMDQALAALVKAGRISMDDALERALNAAELKSLSGRG